jgi:hexosaminidase
MTATAALELLPNPRAAQLDAATLVEGRFGSGARIDGSLPAEGYAIAIGADGAVEVRAGGAAGSFYAGRTLDQLARTHGGRLPVGTVEDWPDLGVRAVMLDISRDKVPTMATLEALIDRLAGWKINQVQLYMEHTFAYPGHEEVWREAGALTAEDVEALDAFCRERHVELVPNQNCLGHWERWLRHERYRPLAIAPEGTMHGSRRRPPTTLDPAKPGALAIVRELLGELLPHFGSPRAHVGLDEPWELPAERFDDYLEWTGTLRRLPELDGREMLVWGDIVAGHPERAGDIPAGVTVCEWGYEDWHPFDARAEVLSGAGRPFWLCPGTSSWLSILGRWSNMIGNIAGAAAAAGRHGASGLLNTDWGDRGHLQYLPVSEPGLAYGAAVSWCLETNRDLDLPAALSRHAFDDPTGELGLALRELGDAHRALTPQFFNISTLTMHLYFPQVQIGRSFTEGLQAAEVDEAERRIDAAVDRLHRARPSRPDGGLIVEELETSAALVRVLCHDLKARLEADGWLASVPERARRRLASELEPVVARHRDLWLARNRQGGLADSTAWLEHLHEVYLSGAPQVDWGGW